MSARQQLESRGPAVTVAKPPAVTRNRLRALSLHGRVGTSWLMLIVASLALGWVIITIAGSYDGFIVGTIASSVVAALALNLLVGQAGIFSLATPAFMALGAYGAGNVLLHSRMGLAAAILLPVVGSFLIGAVLGALALRMRGFYLAIATFGLLSALSIYVDGGGAIVGNGVGFTFPPVSFIGSISDTDWGIAACAVAFVSMGFFASMQRSGVGRALALMRESEEAAACVGVNVVRTKVALFALAGAFGALAGILTAFTSGAVSPDQFTTSVAVEQLAFIIFGGLRSVPGAVLGTAVLMALPNIFQGLGNKEAEIYAAVLLLVLILAPAGMVPLFERLVKRVAGPSWIKLVRGSGFDRFIGRIVGKPVRGDGHALESAAAATLGVRDRGRSIRAGSAGSSRRQRGGDVTAVGDANADAIDVKGITIGYGGVIAVDNVSFAVRSGAMHGLIGPNGAGKSTLVAGLFGISDLRTGEIYVNGSRVQRAGRTSPPWNIAAAGCARTFQTPTVGQGLAVIECVENGAYGHMYKSPWRAGARTATVISQERAARDLARHALEQVHFTGRLTQPVSELSLGDLRRIEFARALVAKPAVIVLDEPTSGLEPSEAEELFALLQDYASAEAGRSVLIVEHNVKLIFGYCTEVTVLDSGCVIANGTPEAVGASSAVKEAYLGGIKATP